MGKCEHMGRWVDLISTTRWPKPSENMKKSTFSILLCKINPFWEKTVGMNESQHDP